MAILPEDLRAPKGLLELAMWPGKDVAAIDAILQVYIDQGADEAADVDAEDVDDAVRAYAYYRAFKARAIQLASMPASLSIPNEESISRTSDQRALFDRLADDWWTTFSGFVVVEDVDSGTGIVPPSGSSDTVVSW